MKLLPPPSVYVWPRLEYTPLEGAMHLMDEIEMVGIYHQKLYQAIQKKGDL
jgi:hypothetical protein